MRRRVQHGEWMINPSAHQSAKNMETGPHPRDTSAPNTDKASLLAISAALSKDLGPTTLESFQPQPPSTTTVKMEDDSSMGAVSSVRNVSFPRIPEPEVPEAILLPMPMPQIQTVEPPVTEEPLVGALGDMVGLMLLVHD